MTNMFSFTKVAHFMKWISVQYTGWAKNSYPIFKYEYLPNGAT